MWAPPKKPLTFSYDFKIIEMNKNIQLYIHLKKKRDDIIMFILIMCQQVFIWYWFM